MNMHATNRHSSADELTKREAIDDARGQPIESRELAGREALPPEFPRRTLPRPTWPCSSYPRVWIRAAIFIALVVSQFAQAATFVVDNTDDAVDMDPDDGVCVTNAGTCTLRAAIQESNALAGTEMIELPNGIYNITIAGSGEQAAVSGDLDITDDLTIEGASAAGTIIDGGALDRIFDIAPVDAPDPEIEVTISRLTVRNGGG